MTKKTESLVLRYPFIIFAFPELQATKNQHDYEIEKTTNVAAGEVKVNCETYFPYYP